jgi:hypothetical protein
MPAWVECGEPGSVLPGKCPSIASRTLLKISMVGWNIRKCNPAAGSSLLQWSAVGSNVCWNGLSSVLKWRSEQRPEAHDQWERPGSSERGRRRVAALSDRCRDVVARQHSQEQVGGAEQSFVKDDGPGPGHYPDNGTEYQPLL